MKKILIRAYLNENLGDDLFVYIILNRYKEQFYLYSKSKYKPFENCNNIYFKGNVITVIFNKLLHRFAGVHDYLETKNKIKYDYLLYVGGSVFIEGESMKFWEKNSKQYSKNFIPYYILGSNVGPYKHEEFLKIIGDGIFKNAEDVCFRDKYSYDLFYNLENVRYASDIVFSLDRSNIKITNNKKVVFSIIDCSRKVNREFQTKYEDSIIKLIEMFDKKGYIITLMSYCKYEGDEESINRILDKISKNKLKNKINIYFYQGNIIEALDLMGDCQIVVATRFHANILGLLMNKAIIPIAYSDKTINVLKDINFKGKIFDIRDSENFNVELLTEEDLNYKLDISFQEIDSEKQFEKLDKILKRRGKNG